MRRRRLYTLAVVPLVVGAAGLGAAAGSQQPVFRLRADTVPVVVTVVTKAGVAVDGLTIEDFEILDNGRRAEVVAFDRQTGPLALRVLIAHTPRLQALAPRVREMAYALIANARPSEPVGISGVWGDMNSLGAFSTDKDLLRRDFEATFEPVPSEGRLWWDTLSDASHSLHLPAQALTPPQAWLRPGQSVWPSGEQPGIRAAVVLSPGMEAYDGVGDQKEWADRLARRIVLDGTIVVGIAFGGRSRDRRLETLARETSGWLVVPDQTTDLALEAERIFTDLRNRYLLGFVPSLLDGKEHRLQIRVRRPGLIVRARTAYLAPKHQ